MAAVIQVHSRFGLAAGNCLGMVADVSNHFRASALSHNIGEAPRQPSSAMA